MKNFLDLLATELTLNVCVNGQSRVAGLHDCLTFDATDTVTVDGIEILPTYSYLATNGKLVIDEPFYCWYHRVSGQGWLLVPR
jgi:hypothetical protein